MELNFIAYAALVLLSAITSFSLGIVAWRNRLNRLPNALFAWLMFSVGLWSATVLLQHIASSYSAKALVSKFVYIGIVCTVATWFLFSLAYTGRSHTVTRRTLLLLSIEPILLFLLVWTNSAHQLMWMSLGLDSSGSFPVLTAEYGMGFWIHATYSYLLLFIGTVLLIQYAAQTPEIYRKQATVLVASMLVPWILNVLYLLGITRYGLTAAGFTVAGMGIAWGLLRLRFLDVVPTARTAVFTSLHDVVMTIDDQNRIVDLNPAAEQLIGCTQAEAIGQRIEKMFTFQPELVAEYGYVPEVHTELAFVNNNPPEYYDLWISPVYNRRQLLVARVVVIRDITMQKVAEKAEREERQLAEALRDVAVALTSTLDASEVFSRILANVEQVLPHDSANIMLNDAGVASIVDVRGFRNGRDIKKLFHQQYIVADIETLRRMSETRQPVILPDVRDFSTWHVNKNQQWIRSFIGVPILQDDEVIGFINLDSGTPGAFQPAHGRRLQAFAEQVAVALKNARLYQALEERNQELDAYAYTIAHDLNSPLALIQGYAGLVDQLDLPEPGHDYLQKIIDTSNRMAEMIDQLLMLAKLRDVETTAVFVDLYPLILSVKMRFEDELERKNIQIDIQQEWLPVLGQPVWIEEVFANLIGNAIKYLGRDNLSPVITIRGEDVGDHVRVMVEDNGLGIGLENQESLFEMFTRFHKEEASGTGLGLTIVQRIVRKLGGEVGVESSIGQGSTFWFTLPIG